MDWIPILDHVHLWHREIFCAEEADLLGVRVSSVLWEKIGVGGAVLPHYHDVAEVIHFTKGTVRALLNGTWRSFSAGDTLIVPKGVIHSVANADSEPTEQVSIFLPVDPAGPANQFFKTYRVSVDDSPGASVDVG